MVEIQVINDNCVIITDDKENVVEIKGYALDLTIKELIQFLNDEEE